MYILLSYSSRQFKESMTSLDLYSAQFVQMTFMVLLLCFLELDNIGHCNIIWYIMSYGKELLKSIKKRSIRVRNNMRVHGWINSGRSFLWELFFQTLEVAQDLREREHMQIKQKRLRHPHT